MKGFLRTVLDIKNPLFNAGLARLEKSTGNDAIDVRLIADITEKAVHIIKKLGLDASDTTGPELYHALLAAVKREDFKDLFAESDYLVVVFDNQVLSMNMIDVIENAHHELSYKKQTTKHGQRALCGEIVARYSAHSRTNEETVRGIAKTIGLLEDGLCYNNHKN